jgi:hypothetical protein
MSEKKFFIAGVQFHPGASKAIGVLEEGDELFLVSEPTNKFDSNAVRIECYNSGGDRMLLGYVPKKLSAEVSAMTEIQECECVVTKVEPNGKTWEMCEVVVRALAQEHQPDLDLLQDHVPPDSPKDNDLDDPEEEF